MNEFLQHWIHEKNRGRYNYHLDFFFKTWRIINIFYIRFWFQKISNKLYANRCIKLPLTTRILELFLIFRSMWFQSFEVFLFIFWCWNSNNKVVSNWYWLSHCQNINVTFRNSWEGKKFNSNCQRDKLILTKALEIYKRPL